MTGLPSTVGQFTLLSEIGRGSFATVWLAEHRIVKNKVAIKVVSKGSLRTEDLQTRFIRELNLIKEMDHPFIAKLFEVLESEAHTFIVQELAERGSLLNLVNKNGRLPEVQARHYFSQLICSLEYLHSERMVAHRDLKAENVLLDRNLNLRLIDFGLSNTFKMDSEFSTACGSPAYVSPEMIRGKPYTKAADIWSAGILLYAMVVGELPFEDEAVQRVLQKIVFTEPLYPSSLSPQLIDLLRKILVKVPSQRLTLDRIKAHPWFSHGEYMQFFSLSFSSDEKFLVKGVDKEIVSRIAALGVDVKLLPQSLLCGEYNDLTAMYFILRRDIVTDQIGELMAKFAGTATVARNGPRTSGSAANLTGAKPAAIPRRTGAPRPMPCPRPTPVVARMQSSRVPVSVPTKARSPSVERPGTSRVPRTGRRAPSPGQDADLDSFQPRRTRTNTMK
jgi:serine/threonine protein kinase